MHAYATTQEDGPWHTREKNCTSCDAGIEKEGCEEEEVGSKPWSEAVEDGEVPLLFKYGRHFSVFIYFHFSLLLCFSSPCVHPSLCPLCCLIYIPSTFQLHATKNERKIRKETCVLLKTKSPFTTTLSTLHPLSKHHTHVCRARYLRSREAVPSLPAIHSNIPLSADPTTPNATTAPSPCPSGTRGRPCLALSNGRQHEPSSERSPVLDPSTQPWSLWPLCLCPHCLLHGPLQPPCWSRPQCTWQLHHWHCHVLWWTWTGNENDLHTIYVSITTSCSGGGSCFCVFLW